MTIRRPRPNCPVFVRSNPLIIKSSDNSDNSDKVSTPHVYAWAQARTPMNPNILSELSDLSEVNKNNSLHRTKTGQAALPLSGGAR